MGSIVRNCTVKMYACDDLIMLVPNTNIHSYLFGQTSYVYQQNDHFDQGSYQSYAFI